MTFEDQVRKLCEEVVPSKSDEEAAELARRLQKLIHPHVEDVWFNLIILPPLGPTTVENYFRPFSIVPGQRTFR